MMSDLTRLMLTLAVLGNFLAVIIIIRTLKEYKWMNEEHHKYRNARKEYEARMAVIRKNH